MRSFSLPLNKRLSPEDSVLEPVFNVSFLMRPTPPNVLVTHCLDFGNVLLCWVGGGDRAKVLGKRRHSCRRPITPQWPSGRGGHWQGVSASEEGDVLFSLQVRHRCYWIRSLLPRFPLQELQTGNERKRCRLREFSELVFVYVLGLCFNVGWKATFPGTKITPLKRGCSQCVFLSLRPFFLSVSHPPGLNKGPVESLRRSDGEGDKKIHQADPPGGLLPAQQHDCTPRHQR